MIIARYRRGSKQTFEFEGITVIEKSCPRTTKVKIVAKDQKVSNASISRFFLNKY
jgi:hypothetical protein